MTKKGKSSKAECQHLSADLWYNVECYEDMCPLSSSRTGKEKPSKEETEERDPMRFITDPKKAALNGFTALFFLILTGMAVQAGRLPLILVYGAFCLVYVWQTLENLRIFCIDEKKASLRSLGRTLCEVPLDKPFEFAIANLKVTKNDDMTKVGAVYIYLSPKALREDERFRMCLRWPPKDVCYLRFSPARLQAIRKYVDQKPMLFWVKEQSLKKKFYPQEKGSLSL